jgi:predicted permease
MKRLLRGLFERLLVLLRRGRFEKDLDDELHFHLEELARRNGEQGMPPAEARIAARRSLGRDAVTKEQVRKETGVHSILTRIDAWRLDFKLGFRMLAKYPGLTLAGGLAMSVGIAISLGFTSGFDAMLYRPPLLEDVVTVRTWNVTIGRRHEYGGSLRDFVRWRDELQSVEDLSAFTHFERRDLITDDGRGDPVTSAQITPSSFRLFRTPPMLGRQLVEEDALDGAAPVVLIGYDIWRTRFGSDPNVVGRDVRLRGTAHTVVGVMPEGFAYPVNHKIWTALRTDPLSYEGDGPPVEIFGRLRPGSSIEGASAELGAVGLLEPIAGEVTREELRPAFVDYSTRHTNVEDTPPSAIHVIQVFFALLLLVPCANVAILVYARTARRQGEIAVRNALGASRSRIIMQLFVEALVLALVAAVAAFFIVRAVFGQIEVLMARFDTAEFPVWFKFSVSSSAAWYYLGLTVCAAAVVGFLPAVQATGRKIHHGLSKVGGGGGMRLGKMWTLMIVAQIAVAVAVLPLGAGVAWNMGRFGIVDHGLTTHDVLTANLVMGYDPPPPTVAIEDYRREYRLRLSTLWDELKSRLEAEPNVSAVTYAGEPPGSLPTDWIPFEPEGVPPSEWSSGFGSWKLYDFVDEGFFDFFDIRLLAGRSFGPDDRDPEATTVIVDRSFVRDVLGERDAVGRRIRMAGGRNREPGPWLEIVGVVEDFPLNASTLMEFRGTIYSAVQPISPGIAVRVGSAPAVFSDRLREITASVDPNLGLSNIVPLDDAYRSRLDRMMGRIIAWTISLAVLSVLLLSTAGIYALTSFAVTQRRREIGIRVALGAHPRRILGSIFSKAASQLAVGVAVGTIVAIPIVSYWEKINFDGIVLSVPKGPGLLIAVAVLVMAVGIVGSLGPAKRGLSVQAADVLREE